MTDDLHVYNTLRRQLRMHGRTPPVPLEAGQGRVWRYLAFLTPVAWLGFVWGLWLERRAIWVSMRPGQKELGCPAPEGTTYPDPSWYAGQKKHPWVCIQCQRYHLYPLERCVQCGTASPAIHRQFTFEAPQRQRTAGRGSLAWWVEQIGVGMLRIAFVAGVCLLVFGMAVMITQASKTVWAWAMSLESLRAGAYWRARGMDGSEYPCVIIRSVFNGTVSWMSLKDNTLREYEPVETFREWYEPVKQSSCEKTKGANSPAQPAKPIAATGVPLCTHNQGLIYGADGEFVCAPLLKKGW